MSDSGEDYDGYSVDDEDQLQPEDTLDGRAGDDILDNGIEAPDRPRAVQAFGITPAEAQQGETIDQRVRQEEPDPDAEADLGGDDVSAADMAGGDDPDAIPAESDVLGVPDATDEVPTLVETDAGGPVDTEERLVADDVDPDPTAGPEQGAMHVVGDGEPPSA